MSSASVSIYTDLIFRREQFAQQLTQAGTEVQTWSQQLSGQTINLAVKATIDTSEVDRMIASLMSRTITIPVQFAAPDGQPLPGVAQAVASATRSGQALPIPISPAAPGAYPSSISDIIERNDSVAISSAAVQRQQASMDSFDPSTEAMLYSQQAAAAGRVGRSGKLFPGGMGRMFGAYAAFRGVSGIAEDAARRYQLQARLARDPSAMTGSDLLTATSYGGDGNAIGDTLFSGLSRLPIIGGLVKGGADWYTGSPLIDAKEGDERIKAREASMALARRFQNEGALSSESTSVGRERVKTGQEYTDSLREIERDQSGRRDEINREAARRRLDAGTDDAKREVVRKDTEDQLKKVSAEGEANQRLAEQARDASLRRQDEEQRNRMGGSSFEAQEMVLRMTGNSVEADRTAIRAKIQQESFAAHQRSQQEGDFYDSTTAPLMLAQQAQQSTQQRGLAAGESEARIGDIGFGASSAMRRAGGDAYGADTAAYGRSIDEKVKKLNDLAYAEGGTAKGAQLYAEAEAEARNKVVNVMARQIEHAHQIGLAAQQTDVGTSGIRMRASSDDLRSLGLDFAAHQQDFQAEKANAAAATQVRLNELSRSGDTVGYAAEVRRGQATQSSIQSRENVYQFQRNREVRNANDAADVSGARYRMDASGADLMELENQNRRDIEGAGGDPAKEAAARRVGADRIRNFITENERANRARPVSGTRDDAYRSALNAAFEDPQTAREREAARISRERAIRKAANDLHLGNILGQNPNAAALNEAADKIKAAEAAAANKAFLDAVNKLGKAADKINDLQLVGVIGP